MNKVIVVSELYYPDKTSTAYILTRIADSLAVNNELMVICSESSYGNENVVNGAVCKNYPIVRVKSNKYDKNKIISRVRNLCSNSWYLINAIRKEVRSGDKVVIVTNPAPLLLCTALLKHFKKFSLTIIVHDIFPENAIAAKLIKSERNLIYRGLKGIFNWAYSSADNLIVLGRDMKDVIENKIAKVKKCPSVYIIENWADEFDEYHEESTDNDFIELLYAGNIGRCQGLEMFVELFSKLDNDNLKLSIRGGGAIEQNIKDFIFTNSVKNINLGGPYIRDEQFSILSHCDIALITLAKGMYGLGVPSKAYNILAAGKAILFVGDLYSEIALMIKENNIGFCFDSDDNVGLINWLNNLKLKDKSLLHEMGRRSRELALVKYSSSEILKKYHNILDL
jgi:glycosyltransferase, family 1